MQNGVSAMFFKKRHWVVILIDIFMLVNITSFIITCVNVRIYVNKRALKSFNFFTS